MYKVESAERKGPMRPLYVFNTFIFVLATLILFSHVHITAAADADTDTATDTSEIVLSQLLFTPQPSTENQIGAVREGFLSAFNYVGNKTDSGRTIRFTGKGADESADNITSIVLNQLEANPNILAFIGPYSDDRVLELLLTGILQKNNLMMMAPFTGSSAIRFFSPYMYFIRADPYSEMLVLLKYATSQINVRRIGFMHLTGMSFGDQELIYTRRILTEMGRDPPSSYAVPYSFVVNQTAFNEFADTKPQAIIIFGLPGNHTLLFVQQCLTDPRTKDAVLLAPAGLTDVLYNVYQALGAAGAIKVTDKQVVMSATNILPTETKFNHIQAFIREMDKWIADGCSKYSGVDPNIYITSINLGELMVAGWLAGKVVLQTLNQPTWVVNRSTYMAGVFQQNRYIVEGDFVYGDYGGACAYAKAATAQGAVCSCNQGGHSTYLKYMDADMKLRFFSDMSLNYPNSECGAAAFTMPRPISLAVFNASDDTVLQSQYRIVAGVVKSVIDSFNNDNYIYHVGTYEGAADDQGSLYTAYTDDHIVDIVFGPATASFDTGSALIINPLRQYPQLNQNNSDVVTLMPTLEQETYVLYAFFNFLLTYGSVVTSATPVHLITKGLNTSQSNVVELVRKTAITFGLKEATVRNIPTGTSVVSQFDGSGVNIMMGFESGDAAAVANFLLENPASFAMLTYTDFSMYYDELISAFSLVPVSVQLRFYTLTSLPMWTDNSTAAHAASTTLQEYHELVTDSSKWTPRGLETYAMIKFIRNLVVLTSDVNATQLKNTLYLNSLFTVDDMHYGPFSSCDITTTSVASSSTCKNRNYGANSIQVLGIDHIIDPTRPLRFPAMTPSMVYTSPSVDRSLSKGQIAGIVVGCVVFVLLVVALIIFLTCCCCGSARDNRNAPKKLEDPVTLVFTDIESSTALWAAVPTTMPDAVATHHKLIRQLIQKYKCYEVKTIGDSFMIASKDAYAAVKLAQELQMKFLKHDWGDTDIDDAYHTFEERKAEDNEEYIPPTANLEPHVYSSIWNGLRVRVGIHTGLSDIRCDQVTGGYDYYGDTSNMSARTEAIGNGGQVVMTEATYWALSDQEREELDCTDMGPQGLRGVPYAVVMYQLNAVPGRHYANLRTEIDAILPDDGFDENESEGTEALLSSAGTLTGPAAAISAVLSSCFSPYPAARRIKELQPLLEKWAIPVPPRNRRIPEEDYCQGLLNRLANKMSTVAVMKQKFNGVGGFSSLSGTGRGSVARPVSQQGGINAAALARLASRHASDSGVSDRRNTKESLPPPSGSRKNTGLVFRIPEKETDDEEVKLRPSDTATMPAFNEEDVPMRRVGNRHRTQAGRAWDDVFVHRGSEVDTEVIQ